MKLIRFQASNVYNQFNFDIEFYPNVTILYGINGCGKTTVLKMINLIISGKFYELKKIKFDEVILDYSQKENNFFLKIYFIDSSIKIETNYEEIKEYIDKVNFNLPLKSARRIEANEELLEKFNQVFNAIFMSIERKVQKSIVPHYLSDKNFHRFLRHNYGEDIESFSEPEIIRLYEIYRIEYQSYYERKRFRKEPLLEYNPIDGVINLITAKFKDYLKYCSKLDKQYQEESYKKMMSLKKIDEIKRKLLEFDKESMIKAKDRIFAQPTYFIDEFEIPEEEDFQKLINNFEIQKRKVNEGGELSGDYLLTLIQFIKLDESAILLENNNTKKDDKYVPFKLLIDNLNDFFSDTKKRTLLEDEKIKFELRNKEKIDPHNLSSGEKQILIFFTYLIFNEHDNLEPVILYDEPDLSLHLEWQEKFIDSVLEVNPTIQIILATHSPGIGSERFDANSISLENSFIED